MVPTLMKAEIEQKLLEELKAEMAIIRTRRSKLAQHDRLIGAMREQGAPWTIVQRYLAKVGVEVSAEGIRAYWQRHYKLRRRLTSAAAVEPRTKQKQWTFNAPSKLEEV
jgi:hypothetical protein